MTMTPLPALQFCSSSPPTSSRRRAAASETPIRTRSRLTTSGKIHTQLSRSASSPKAEASDPGVGVRYRGLPDLALVFKSP